MTGLSGISGKIVSRTGGQRFKVQWPARFFLEDKIIHQATIIAVFDSGFCLHFDRAIGIGKQMHLELLASKRSSEHRIRVKGKVDYCLLREDTAEVDVLISAISQDHEQLLESLLQDLRSPRPMP